MTSSRWYPVVSVKTGLTYSIFPSASVMKMGVRHCSMAPTEDLQFLFRFFQFGDINEAFEKVLLVFSI